jgi:hypothetical protein
MYKIEISGIETLTDTSNLKGVGNKISARTMGPSTEDTLQISLSKDYRAGYNCVVKVYNRAGNVYSVTVQAK